MLENQDLHRRFNNTKDHMVMCLDKYETVEPTDKEVWEFMRQVAKIRQDEALADDMEDFVRDYQIRIKLIDEQLNLLK